MPVNHRVIQSNGIRMHLAEEGAGPLVILCHGWPESWYSWPWSSAVRESSLPARLSGSSWEESSRTADSTRCFWPMCRLTQIYTRHGGTRRSDRHGAIKLQIVGEACPLGCGVETP